MNQGAQNAVVGDITDATELPQTQIKEEDLAPEKNMAKFSKSKEYQKLKEYLESRIEFFQTYLPDGKPLTVENIDVNNWKVANLVIGEFKAVLQAYENAQEVVDNVNKAINKAK